MSAKIKAVIGDGERQAVCFECPHCKQETTVEVPVGTDNYHGRHVVCSYCKRTLFLG